MRKLDCCLFLSCFVILQITNPVEAVDVDSVTALKTALTSATETNINFTQDITLGESVSLNSSVEKVVDGNSHNLSGTVSNPVFTINGKATFKNFGKDSAGNIVGDGISGYNKIIFDNRGTLNIENSVFKNTTNSAIKNQWGPYTVSITNSDFINCSASTGSVIVNSDTNAKITEISGNFEGNHTTSAGGVINNSNGAQIEKISGTFNSNYSGGNGGVINNAKDSKIDSIDGTFTGNYTTGSGGVLITENNSQVSTVNGTYIGNHSTAGGVMRFIASKITTVDGTYQENYANSDGGVIWFSGQLETLKGTYIKNHSADEGGVLIIKDSGVITQIKDAVFRENYSTGKSGGVIYLHNGAITNGIINSTFTDNYAKDKGGAIHTLKDLLIVGDNGTSLFKGNYLKNGSTITPEAIYVENDNLTLTLKTQNNGNIQVYDPINGKSGYKTVITGDSTGTLELYNDIKLSDISTENVTIKTANDEIFEYDMKKLTSNANTKNVIDIDVSNPSDAKADTFKTGSGSTGRITLHDVNLSGSSNNFTVRILKAANDNIQLALDEDTINKDETDSQYKSDSITDDVAFDETFDSYQKDIRTVEIYGLTTSASGTTNDSLTYNKTVTDSGWYYIGNQGDTLALLNQHDSANDRNFNFATENDTYTVKSDLGETKAGTLNINGIANGETKSTIDADGHNLFELENETNLNIKNVKINNANTIATGTNTDAQIELDNVDIQNNTGGIKIAGSVTVKGNSTLANNGEGIEVTSDTSVVTLDAANGEINLNDKISGVDGSKLYLNNGIINVDKELSIKDITMDNSTVNLKNETLINNADLTVQNSPILNLANNSVGVMNLNNLKLNSDLNLAADVDLASRTMDRLSASTYSLNGNNVNITGMNLLTDTTAEVTRIYFADSELKNNVTTSISEIAYSPIHKFKVTYDNSDGYFEFRLPSHGGGGGGDKPAPIDFNPAVLTTPIMNQAGVQSTLNETFNYAYNHADTFTKLPKMKRLSEIESNKYAINSTEFNNNLPNYNSYRDNSAVWFRPYTTFENIPLKNGPKVSAISYGALVGFDSNFQYLKHGWNSVLSGYVGYNGSQLRYSGIDTSLNGGLLGVTETFYKNNFWTALTATAGASVAETHNMYGHEYSTNFLTGVGSKTGYNFEFNEGKFIIQPIWFMSYSFINTFDYKNAAGVKINSKPLNTIMMNPSVRLIGNINGWQPYASVGMVWNIMDKTDVSANGVRLPEMHIKPYVQYGVGLQKQIGECFTGFLQAMLHNGGRNGISITGGFRWAIGKNQEVKVETPQFKTGNKVSHIIKSQKHE